LKDIKIKKKQLISNKWIWIRNKIQNQITSN